MDISLQIIIGFIPALIISLLLVTFSKQSRAQWVTALALMMSCCVGSVILVNSPVINNFFEKEKANHAIAYDIPAKADDYLQLSYAFMSKGEYDEAARTLAQYIDSCEYTSDYVLALARLNVLQEQYEEASGLYSTVMLFSKTPSIGVPSSEEFALIDDAVNHPQQNEQITKNVLSYISDLVEENQVALEVATQYTEIFEQSAGWQSLSSDSKESVGQRFEEWTNKMYSDEDTASYLSIPIIQEAVFMSQAMSQNYTQMLNNLVDKPEVENLLLTAELINDGQISADDIRQLGTIGINSSSEELANWINNQASKNSYDADEQAVIEGILDELTNQNGDASTSQKWIEEQILNYIMNNSDSENSKLYLELARLEHQAGKDDTASLYLNMALGEAGNSKDKEYLGAANALLQVVQGDNDTEEMKNVSSYTATLTEQLFSNGMEGISASVQNSTADESVAVNSNGATSFHQYITDTINQSAGSVDILSVDSSQFDEISAIVTVDESLAKTADAFKAAFDVVDCNAQIDDYDIDKIHYSDVNMVLVCDNSGSMNGDKIDNLRSALRTFIQMSSDINIAIVPFDSGVQTSDVCSFGSELSAIKECVDSMSAGGGTNIFSAVNYALDMLPNSKDALNVMIVMSDGQDSAPSDDSLADLASSCEQKNAVIYTMGLGGDVDSNVLDTYSDAGNGSYMYVTDSDTLYSFYQHIYKLSMNQYKISFTAFDTVRTNRKLEVESKTVAGAQDELEYYLYEDDVSEDNLGEDYQITLSDVTLNGLEDRLFYQGSVDQKTKLTGSGFSTNDNVKIEIKGGLKYTLNSKIIDDSNIEVIVPYNVACGVYDVYVTYNEKRVIFQSGFVMTSTNRNIVRFGDYVFTATNVSTLNDSIKLDGVVEMNNWLGFKGTVTLTGNLKKDYSATLNYQKAFVQYANNETSTGLAHYLGKKGYTIPIPGDMTFTLYHDSSVSSSDDAYPVKAEVLFDMNLSIVDFITISTPGMSIYPNRIVYDYQAFDTHFPFQKALIKANNLDELYKFDLEHSEKLIITNEKIGCNLSFEIGQNDDKYTPISGKLGNLKMYYRKSGLKIELDTVKGDIDVKVSTDIAFLADGIGTEITWKDWNLESIEIFADAELNTYIANVPVTFHDFGIKISGLAECESITEIFKQEISGRTDISMAKLSAVYPGLKKATKDDIIADAAVASLDDVTVTARLKDLYFSVEAKAKILGLFDVGKCKLELGNGISYTNLLLGLDDQSVCGFVGSLTIGLQEFKTSNLKIECAGTLEIALTNYIVGVGVDGDYELEISWWVLEKRSCDKGEMFIGTHCQHSGEWQFVVYAAGTNGETGTMTPICWPTDALRNVDL